MKMRFNRYPGYPADTQKLRDLGETTIHAYSHLHQLKVTYNLTDHGLEYFIALCLPPGMPLFRPIKTYTDAIWEQEMKAAAEEFNKSMSSLSKSLGKYVDRLRAVK